MNSRWYWVITMGVMMPVISDANRDRTNPLNQSLSQVRASAADLSIRTDLWETRFRLPIVDMLLRQPLTIVPHTEDIADKLQRANTSAALLREAAEWLDTPLTDHALPRSGNAVDNLEEAIHNAQPLLDQAVESLSADARKHLLTSWQAVFRNHETSAVLEDAVRDSGSFDVAPLMQAAYDVMRAVDDALPALRELKAPVEREHLIIRVARQSHYNDCPAAATERQIRVVIDFGEDVTVDRPDGACAGSGLFGIGLFYLPNKSGTKSIRTGDFSQGAGLFGVGGLFVAGSRATFVSNRATQGAGAFGVGLFQAEVGPGASYDAQFAAQGVGFPRGVGLFRHRGNQAVIRGGLSDPDPREPLGFTSICQGVGYGPRAFAAGGAGLALIEGDDNTVESSYFAQGAGYWFGYGGFFVMGNGNQFQARRYVQGSGIHTAVGAMLVRGERNVGMTWGVGPAYGWDYGIGQLILQGNTNHLQADWATGHGEINGHGLAWVRGDHNTLALPGFGSGTLNRNAPSYGLIRVEGIDNRLPHAYSLWGTQDVSTGTVWDEKPAYREAHWPAVPNRDRMTQEEKNELAARFKQAASLAPADRIAARLDIASNFGLESDIPDIALQTLWTLPDGELPLILDRISSDRMDEFLLLRTLAAVHAERLGSQLMSAYQVASGTRRMQLLSLAAFFSPAPLSPLIETALSDPDWRLRRTALSILGYWFNQEEGNAPGRLFLLSGNDRRLRALTGEKYLADVMAIVSQWPGISIAERGEFKRVQPDINAPVTPQAWDYFVRLRHAHAKATQSIARQERETTSRLKDHFLPLVLAHLKDPDLSVVHQALLTLGLWGDRNAAAVLLPFIDSDCALWREAAATALGKCGPRGRHAILELLKSPLPIHRLYGIVAASQSWDPKTKKSLRALAGDEDPMVRSAVKAVFPSDH